MILMRENWQKYIFARHAVRGQQAYKSVGGVFLIPPVDFSHVKSHKKREVKNLSFFVVTPTRIELVLPP